MNLKRHIVSVILILFLLILLLNSFYTVRLKSAEGLYNPSNMTEVEDYYNGMEVIELDTVITINRANRDFTYLIKATDKCPSGKLHTIEYSNTLGGLFLNVITFGRKRMVKIKYVCMASD